MQIKIPKTQWVDEWYMKEEASWEDSKHDRSHAAAVLQMRGKTVYLTEEQRNNLIKSGEYQSTAWNDDEIAGGARTKQAIANFIKRLQI